MKDYETIEIDITYEQYFFLNEEARKKDMLLDEFINEILLNTLKDESFIKSLKTVE